MTAEITIIGTRILLVRGDITREKVHVIVNAANSSLMGGGGVDGAIRRAGGEKIKEECNVIVNRIGRLPAGQVVITSGGNLQAKYIIHTVGPVWRGGDKSEDKALASCYRESMRLASSESLKSTAFPSISTGVYGYPPGLAATIAVNTVAEYLLAEHTSIELVEFVLYDDYSFSIYQKELETKNKSYKR